MLIVQDGLKSEAACLDTVLTGVFGFQNTLVTTHLNGTFKKMEIPNGFYATPVLGSIISGLPDEKIFVLTNHDLYAGENPADDWVFGVHYRDFMVGSVARLRTKDGKPSDKLEVPWDTYIGRLRHLGVHEVGHDTVKGNHLVDTFWVNDQTDYQLDLGRHCPDPDCIMYAVVDLQSPTDGYLLIGDEKRFDAGLDDAIKRIRPGWFCPPCKASMKIDELFYSG